MRNAASGRDITRRRPIEDVTIAPGWLESPEVREAVRRSGWPECSVADLLQALLDVVDAIETRASVLDEVLRQRGMTFPEFCELVADAKAHEGPLHTLSAPEERAVRRLFLAGFDADQVAGMLELPASHVRDYVAKQRYPEKGPLIVQLHLRGLTPLQIVAESGVSRSTVYSVLEDAGQQPNRTLRLLDERRRAQIVKLYRAGMSYGSIMKELNVDKGQVSNTLRLAHRRGDCPEYGSRAS